MDPPLDNPPLAGSDGEPSQSGKPPMAGFESDDDWIQGLGDNSDDWTELPENASQPFEVG